MEGEEERDEIGRKKEISGERRERRREAEIRGEKEVGKNDIEEVEL